MNNLLATLTEWDHAAWRFLHGTARAAVLDAAVPFFRNQYFWAPLYLFLTALMLINYRWRGVAWCLGFLLAFALADHISAGIIKPWAGRVRPCNDPAMAPSLHLLVPCGGGLSFPSSHASNHFALGVYTAATLGHLRRWVAPAAILWGCIVAYSQVYVGVHYPLDVLAGAGFGTVLGGSVAWAYNRWIGLQKVA